MRKLLRFVVTTFYKPFLDVYLKKDRTFRYGGISILIKQGVFHPGFFYSTHMLLEELEKVNVQNKNILELGAGSGLISFIAAKKGATVWATDIHTVAIEGLYFNNQRLATNIHILHSDLFDHIPLQQFDLIIINPPYYPKNPANDMEKAWFCGANYQYFRKLFDQLGVFMHRNSDVWMSLSEDCDVVRIKQIAEQEGYRLDLIRRKRYWGEVDYIFKIRRDALV